MRKQLLAAFLMVAALFSMTLANEASAGSVTAANIFNTIGGTTTIDKGGSIHSQARSIYSFGGGMVSFQGKRVSLLAADPPSFSAGCSGISWHFGGFAFISMDEIRQLVEAVAQASLGVAVDLAMQTLCPQCYAVMAKLRDISNLMRNAAANSCQIAHMLGNQLVQAGIFSPTSSQSDCSQSEAEDNSVSSILQGAIGPCSQLNDVMGRIAQDEQNAVNWLNKSMSSGTTPNKAQFDGKGNMTYEALSALGYTDGVVKDFLLSYTGMAIIEPVPGTDCRQTFTSLFGSAQSDQGYNDTVNQIIGAQPGDAVPATGSTQPNPSMANTNAANTSATDSDKGPVTCFAPPLNAGVTDLAKKLICGFNPTSDKNLFLAKFNLRDEDIQNSSIYAMCAQAGNGSYDFGGTDNTDPYIYHCDASSTSRCMRPQLLRLSQDTQAAVASNGYTGLGWMIMDALYAGVAATANDQPWPQGTLSLVNGSDYPLYRLINIAAVYPGMADEMLQAYSGVIAVQYALDTLDKLTKPGGMPGIDTRSGKGGLQRTEVSELQKHIFDMLHDAGPMREQVMKRLSEKRALVDVIVQVNRALQAEVISQGLGGNADLAVSIKRQAAARAATVGNQGQQGH
ncbi:conjugal transfer protein TraH [Burkholderia ambifaria]|uniref:conjugal transfer protein TraH n=1 Tax=Burkholderia ambifaria TaxID=152480 RepID=UPI000F8132EF|nr:conjugal transfer protein TraH [Burkholderia ambifaria]